MDDKRLEEIEARLNRATPGPWKYRWTYDIPDNYGNLLSLDHYIYTQDAIEPYKGLSEKRQQKVRDYGSRRLIARITTIADEGEADGEFIANAWQDIRDLLQEIQQLRAQVYNKEGAQE